MLREIYVLLICYYQVLFSFNPCLMAAFKGFVYCTCCVKYGCGLIPSALL